MKKHVYDYTGTVFLRVEDATPVCGQDFCDACGDCLACYGSDPCPYGDEHFWVEYEEKEGPKEEV